MFIGFFYKELKLGTFDAALAASLGFSPVLIHYLLMAVLSVTVVGAFESVGAILVVAMLVVPAATAYLLTERLSRMLLLSVGFGVASAWLGYGLARVLDASIAGAMASVAGLLFAVVFALSPRHGLLAKVLRQRRLGVGMAEHLLLLHLASDDGDPAGASPFDTVRRRFGWRPKRLRRLVDRLGAKGWLDEGPDGLRLTPAGVARLERTGHAPLRHALTEG